MKLIASDVCKGFDKFGLGCLIALEAYKSNFYGSKFEIQTLSRFQAKSIPYQ